MSYFITTAIAYVNGQPHLGHAYEEIATDVLARHMRQRGEDVFFLTGTDEHGEPVADAAHAEGISPQELADRNAERFKALMPQLEISNDFFIRTTDPEHKLRVQRFLQTVYDNGYVYKGIYEGWYCPRCADFKTETEIVDGNRCPIHEIVLTREQEENWFFKLSAFQEQLERLYADQPDFVMPARAMNEAKAFVGQGLQDISLSRSKLTWGVTVPWDESHVFYVWFDALLNYYTALGYARPGEDLTDRYWPANLHVIGKDILKFHTIFWPAMLMAAGVAVPEHVFVHGFLMAQDGRKMSKSLGNVLDPFEVHRELRHRRAALLPDARGGVRQRRQRRHGRPSVPLRLRARQRVRQPRQPHAGDDRPLPRRCGASGRRPTRCCRPSSPGCRRWSPSCSIAPSPPRRSR